MSYCWNSQMRYYSQTLKLWIEVNGNVRNGCLFVSTLEYDPVVTIVLTYHTFQFYSKCFYHYFELQSNHLMKQKSNHIFQVSTRNEIYSWKERIESSTPSIYDINRYSVSEQLGHGAFGIVRKAYDTMTDTYVAMKILPNVYGNRTLLKNSLRELRILEVMNHGNIIKFHDVFISEDTLYLITELCQRDLLRVLQSYYHTLQQANILSFTKQLLSAVEYIHSIGIMHRDIKPSNILLTSNFVVKLCDFGMARKVSEHYSGKGSGEDIVETPLSFRGTPTRLLQTAKSTFTSASSSSSSIITEFPTRRSSHSVSSGISIPNSQYSEYVVTRWYRAPEILLSKGNYRFPQDVWAVGCTLCELFTRRPIFPGHSRINQIERIFHILGCPPFPDFITSQSGQAIYLNLAKEYSATGLGLISILPNNNNILDGDTFGFYVDMLQNMLQINPNDRITCTAALQNHKLFPSEYTIQDIDLNVNTIFTDERTDLTLSDIDDTAMNRKGLIRLLHSEIQAFKMYTGETYDHLRVRPTQQSKEGIESRRNGNSNNGDNKNNDLTIVGRVSYHSTESDMSDMMDVSEEDNKTSTTKAKTVSTTRQSTHHSHHETTNTGENTMQQLLGLTINNVVKDQDEDIIMDSIPINIQYRSRRFFNNGPYTYNRIENIESDFQNFDINVRNRISMEHNSQSNEFLDALTPRGDGDEISNREDDDEEENEENDGTCSCCCPITNCFDKDS